MPGTVLTLDIPSAVLGRAKRATVLLPRDYREDGPAHPVLYLLHGYGGGRGTWLERTRLAKHLDGSRLIVIMPESGRRWFVNDHAGLRYEDHFVRELLPAVDARFHTLAERSARAVGGFSMGGATALFLALRHRALFGAVTSHAGAFEAPRRIGDPYREHRGDPGFVMPTVESHERVWGPPGSATRRTYDPYRLITRGDPLLPPALYLDVGTGDHERMVRMNRSVRAALEERGWPVVYRERPGGHDWEFVDGALPSALDFLHARLARTTRIGV